MSLGWLVITTTFIIFGVYIILDIIENARFIVKVMKRILKKERFMNTNSVKAV
jgi:hypothetical protein